MHANNKVRDFGPTIHLALGMAISGTVGVFAVQSGQPTVNVVFFRCIFGFLSLGAWCFLTGRASDLTGFDRRSLLLGVLSGVFLVLNWVAIFEAFRLTSIGFATIIYHLQPFWIVLVGGFLLGETVSRSKYCWIAFAFMGLLLAVGPKIGAIDADAGFAAGVIYALIASMLYAASTLTVRAMRNAKPEALSALHCLIGAVLFLPFMNAAVVPPVSSPAWLWLAGIGVVHTGIVYVLLYSAYPRLPTTAIAVLAFLNPVTALLADFLVYGRAISLSQAAGLVLILLAGLGVNLGWRFPISGRVGKADRMPEVAAPQNAAPQGKAE